MSALERALAGAGWRIGEPALLAALLAVALAAAIAAAAGIAQRRALLRGSFGGLAARVAPGAAPGARILRVALSCAGVALLALGAARPQAATRTDEPPATGIDLAILLDGSRSMLARDVRPDRLARATRDVVALVDRLPGVRVAVVAFAGGAHLQSPLTADLGAAKLLLDAVDPAAMPRQGTDVAAALDAAARALEPSGERGAARAALLVGDGEDHGDGAAQAAERLALAGIPLFTAGVGTAAGAPVPLPGGGPLRDASGRMVISRLDEERLSELAARGGGRYVRLDGSASAVAELAAALARLERSPLRAARVSSWDERFDRFAIAGVILLALGAALPEARRRRPGSRAPGGALPAAAAAAALFLGGAAPFLAEHEGLAEANALAATDPEAALRLMDAVEREVGPRAEIDVDRGIALFRAGRLDEARRSFSLAVRAPGPLASRGVYGEGVAALAQGDEVAALAAWRRALVLDPANAPARFNLEVLLRRRGESAPGEGRGAGPEPAEGRARGDRSGDADGPGGDLSEAQRGGPEELRALAPAGGRAGEGAETRPMSSAEAQRLLDHFAAGERVTPMTPPRVRGRPQVNAW